MKGFLYILILSFFVFSCSETMEKPKNLLSEKQMETILTEMYLYQQPSYLTALHDQPVSHAKIDAQLLTKHQVTQEVFEESFKYYVLIPDTFKSILGNVRKNLEAKLPEEERKRMQDELKNLENSKN